MDKLQVANWKRHLKVRAVRNDNASAQIPPLVQRIWARHEALLATIEDLLATPVGRTTGATLQKSAEEKRVIAAALPLANALYLLYLEDEQNPQASQQAHALRRNKSDYTNLPSPLVLAETKNVAQQAQALKAKLKTEAGLEAADLQELTDANATFDTLLTAPQTIRSAGKTARTDLGTTLKAADKFIDTDLKPSTKTLKTKFPQLHDALLDAMRIDNAPGPRKKDSEKPDTPKV